MSDKLYQKALHAALTDLEKLKEREREIAVRKAQLQQTINALYPLAYPDGQPIDLNSMSLPNAMRLIIQSAGRPLSASDFRTKLQDMGFDTSKYDDPLVNIYTAMKRMVDADEMEWSEIPGPKKAIPGPELKQVPQAMPDMKQLFGTLSDLVGETKEGGK